MPKFRKIDLARAFVRNRNNCRRLAELLTDEANRYRAVVRAMGISPEQTVHADVLRQIETSGLAHVGKMQPMCTPEEWLDNYAVETPLREQEGSQDDAKEGLNE